MTVVTTPLAKGELLDQRGRAELEFLQGLRAGLAPLRSQVREQAQNSGALDLPFDSIEALRERVDNALASSSAHHIVRSVLRWSRAVATPRAARAFERGRSTLQPLAAPQGEAEDLTQGQVPAYWDYPFHMTAGGWDGHDEMGFIHHEMIYYFLLQKLYPGDIFGMRTTVAKACPRRDYQAIIDLGCGTGQYSLKLAEVFPDAQLTLVDLSETQLRYAMRRAEDAQITVRAVRAAAEDTHLPDASADLVTSFIMFHEMPAEAIAQVFKEAYRLLQPGGQIHFSDVAPYHQRSLFQAWLDDWDADNANEPYWRDAATIDLAACAQQAGFIEINQQALGADAYPWVITATKPASDV